MLAYGVVFLYREAMSNQEVSPLSETQARAYPDWYQAKRSSDEEANKQLVAVRIAEILMNPENQVFLDTLYEGSTFTTTMGEELGFEVIDNPSNPSKQESLDPVRGGIDTLRKAHAIEHESYPITDIETVRSAGDTVTEHKVDKLLIRVIAVPEKMQKFLSEAVERS